MGTVNQSWDSYTGFTSIPTSGYLDYQILDNYCHVEFWFYDFEIDNSIININVYNDETKNSLYLSKQFVMNDELLNTVNEIGTFKYINQ
jgi:hypothetical protein